MTAPLALDPRLGGAAMTTPAMARTAISAGSAETARAQAQDFEAMFLGSMFQHMFTGMDGDGPLGGGPGVGIWRSFLSDEYAKSFAKAGGIGLADHVYRSLLGQQEVTVK